MEMNLEQKEQDILSVKYSVICPLDETKFLNSAVEANFLIQSESHSK